jgi:hypothetical protein
VILVVLALLALPPAALAQAPAVPSIAGKPLQVFAAPDGAIQVKADGREANEFYPQATEAGNAGFGLVVDRVGNSPQFWGAFAAQRFPAPTVPATLQAGSPSTLTTEWDLPFPAGDSPRIHLKQVVSYKDGNREFTTTFTISNVAGNPVTVRPFVGGDLAIRGSDQGVGLSNLGPPRFIGGLNQDVGGSGGFVELTPWAHFQSGQLGDVSSAATGTGFNDTISPSASEGPVDNAAGVEWPEVSLLPGQPQTYSVGWRFFDTLGITPATATQTTGLDQSFTASLADENGRPLSSGKQVVWNVAGQNSSARPTTTTTGKNGRADFSYVGGAPGEDVVTAFVDSNRNGNRDTGEPQATANVTWVGPAAPIQGESVNVRPEKGTVLIQLPKGTASKRAAKRLGVSPATAAKRFVRLRGNIHIPLGATLDTRRGTVRLLAAGAPTKSTGSTLFMGGSFNGSKFLVNQSHGGSGTTELSAKGSIGKCGTRVPKGGSAKVVASRKRKRSLFGRAHGRFRTRGRNSSATVRGTKWTMTDTCKGTLTVVKSGRVTVKDFRTRKRRTLKAGQRYLARALRKHRK